MKHFLTYFAALLLAPLQVPDTGASVKSPLDSVAIQIAIAAVPEGAAPSHATLSIELKDGVSGSESGIPGFIIQLDPPKGLELVGEPVVEFEELRSNQFLMEPWERVVEPGQTMIEFKVTPALAETATLGINVLGYVASKEGGDDAFLRQRFELEINGGATAVLGDPTDSSWGPFGGLPEEERPLVIGDKAPDFVGPTLTAEGVGKEASLGALMASGPLVIAAYRGHW